MQHGRRRDGFRRCARANDCLLEEIEEEGIHQFLQQTAQKAGLPPDAWKRKEVKLFTFTVDKFDESEFEKEEK